MRKNLIGIKFGSLIGIEGEIYKLYGKRKVFSQKVLCKCGKEYFSRRDHLLGGRINNCGCDNTERIKQIGYGNKRHGMDGTKFYHVWTGIKSRCYYKRNKCYRNYGGRGIIVCDRWLESFENFRDDMYDSYLLHFKNNRGNTSIDRTDVDGNYCKDNCEWKTMKEQARNRRNNVICEVNGKEMLLCEITEKYGFKPSLVSDRLKSGRNIDKIINTPVKQYNYE